MSGRLLRDLVVSATQKLSEAGIDNAPREASLLAAFAAGIAHDRVAISMNDPVDQGHWEALDAVLRARLERKPISHILGYRDFFDHRFKIGPQVLDPRPETEVLVRAALGDPYARILDLGTGSGAILISLLAAREDATGIGSDLSQEALEMAAANAERIGVSERCSFVRSDWFSALQGSFDLIVSNPPYIAADEMAGLSPELGHEPRMALTDESDGLAAYRAITSGVNTHLVPGGRLMVEIGPTQGQIVSGMFDEAGLEAVSILPDLDGRDRVVMGKLPRRSR